MFDFFQTLEANSKLKKGVKLDFKRTDILQDSLQIVQSFLPQIDFPVWINADIIKGPSFSLGQSGGRIVEATEFLRLATELLPTATISPGIFKSPNISMIDGHLSKQCQSK